MLFKTSYQQGSNVYMGVVEAASLGDAQKIAERRGLGEGIDQDCVLHSFRLRSLVQQELWFDAAHEACYLGFLAVKSGVCTIDTVIGDEGIVHELIHMGTIWSSEAPCPVSRAYRDQSLARITRLVDQLETLVPGHARSTEASPPAPQVILNPRTVR